jgi:hypothetical protein
MSFKGSPSPQAQELIECLSEEAAEVIQISMKSCRHGLNSKHEDYDNIINTDLLATEIGHFEAYVDMLIAKGIIKASKIAAAKKLKHAKIGKKIFLHHLR